MVCRWTDGRATRRVVVAAASTTRVKINIAIAGCPAGVLRPAVLCRAGRWVCEWVIARAAGRTCCLCTSSPQRGPRACRPHVGAARRRPAHARWCLDSLLPLTSAAGRRYSRFIYRFARQSVADSFITVERQSHSTDDVITADAVLWGRDSDVTGCWGCSLRCIICRLSSDVAWYYSTGIVDWSYWANQVDDACCICVLVCDVAWFCRGSL